MMKRLVDASRRVTLEHRKFTAMFMGIKAPVLRPPGPSRTASAMTNRQSQDAEGLWSISNIMSLGTERKPFSCSQEEAQTCLDGFALCLPERVPRCIIQNPVDEYVGDFEGI